MLFGAEIETYVAVRWTPSSRQAPCILCDAAELPVSKDKSSNNSQEHDLLHNTHSVTSHSPLCRVNFLRRICQMWDLIALALSILKLGFTECD